MPTTANRRQEALAAISSLNDESTRKEILEAFSKARAAFRRRKAFDRVETAAWDTVLGGQCPSVLRQELVEFAAAQEAA